MKGLKLGSQSCSGRQSGSGKYFEPSQSLYRRPQVQRTVVAKVVHPVQKPTRRTERESILLQRFKGHNAAVTSVLVPSDTENSKEIVTASLDKSVAVWQLPLSDEEQAPKILQQTKLTPDGAPIFALVHEPPSYDSSRQQIFCGNAAKSVVSWDVGTKSFDKKVKLNGHTGWVRALATNSRYLFSSGCNKISQWDLSRSVPRKCNEINIYTGDVQGLVTGGGRLFSCGADGSIRSWLIGKKGEIQAAAAREKAHKDRVSAIAYKSGFLYSTSLDGSVKMWDANTLELVMTSSAAHGGGKVHCLTVGPEGHLFTGGEDKLIRRWELGTLTAGSSLHCHHYPVRALASGTLETLISADSSGEVAIWKV